MTIDFGTRPSPAHDRASALFQMKTRVELNRRTDFQSVGVDFSRRTRSPSYPKIESQQSTSGVADREPHRERGGVVLVAAIVCLSVATALVVVTTRQAVDARRQGRQERQLRQTEYLLDAGIRRAIAGLRADTSYAGETWQPLTALPDFEIVNVVIEIGDGSGGSEDRRVTVVARLGKSSSPGFQTQRTHTFSVPPPPTADTESSVEPDATDAAEAADRAETTTILSTPDPE